MTKAEHDQYQKDVMQYANKIEAVLMQLFDEADKKNKGEAAFSALFAFCLGFVSKHNREQIKIMAAEIEKARSTEH